MKTDIGLPPDITTPDAAYIAGVFDGQREERKRVSKILEEQATRCRKPHFNTVNYKDRIMVENWNLGVDSLLRQLRRAINERA